VRPLLNYARLLRVALFVLLLSIAANTYSFTISGQNEARYGRGIQIGRGPTGKFFYFENFLELSARLDQLRFYVRQGYRLPGEFDQRVEGMEAFDKYYTEYTNDELTIRAGDFYRVWGKGILFGNMEIRDICLDSGLEGLLAEGRFAGIEASAMKGVETDTNGVTLESAEGAYLSIRFLGEDKPGGFGYWSIMSHSIESAITGTRIGGAYIHFDESPRHPEFERHGVEFEKEFSRGSFYAVYASDRFPDQWWQDLFLPPERTHRFYHALFTTGSIYGDGWSLYLDYRNYKLFQYMENRRDMSWIWAMSLQYPPIGRPENTFRLMDSYPRSIRYYDDIGYQAEFTAGVCDWDFLLNYSNSATADKDGVIARQQNCYSPYSAILAKADHTFEFGDRLGLSLAAQRDVDYSREFQLLLETSKRLGMGADYERRIWCDLSLEGEAQVMSVVNFYGAPPQEHYWEQYIGLTGSKVGVVSLTLGLMRSENDRLLEGAAWPKGFIGSSDARCWPMADFVLQILERHRLDLFYGYERGGISCTGGVCRVVNPFKGVKLTLISHF